MNILIVVDMQHDFIEGALGTKEAVQIVEPVRQKILSYQKCHNTIIFTRDTHDKEYLTTQEGKNLPVEHCIKGTKGWELHEKLRTLEGIIMDKPTFGSLALIDVIKGLLTSGEKLESIELIGVCTDICVISNALILKAAFLETIIKVDAACCAGVTKESHKNALEAMKMCQIKVINEP